MRPRSTALALALLLLAPSLGLADGSAGSLAAPDDAASSPLVGPGVEEAIAAGAARVVVSLRSDDLPARLALADALARAGSDAQALRHAPGILATVDAAGLALLRAHPGLSAVSLDQTAEPFGDCDLEPAEAPDAPWWHGNRTSLDLVRQAGIDGEGRVVAIVDSGVDATHPDLAGSWAAADDPTNATRVAQAWHDAVAPGSPAPVDACGHGTAVAGVAVGATLGVAPGARWIAARVGAVSGTTSTIFAAFEWLLDLGEARPDVVVNSWGFPSGLDQASKELMVDYVNAFKEADVLALFAAGDGAGTSTVAEPADYPEAIAVSGLLESGARVGPLGPSRHLEGGVEVPADSRVHRKPNFVAPADLVSTWPGGGYARAFGTSFAAPFAAGVALLALEEHPWMSAHEVALTLHAASNFRQWSEYDPANPALEKRPNDHVGYGALNAQRAVAIPAETARRVLLVGDYLGTFETLLERAGLDVTPVAASDADVAQQLVDDHAVVVLANLHADVNLRERYDAILDDAARLGRGVVALGDPGALEFDGVQQYALWLQWGVASGTGGGTLSGVVTGDPHLFPTHPPGTSIPLRTDRIGTAVDGVVPAEGSDVLPALVPDGSTNVTGTFFATHVTTGARVALLANAGASGANLPRELTPQANDTILRAIEWARHGAIDPDAVDVDLPTPIAADVLVVGDANAQIAALVTALGFTHAAVAPDDFEVLRLSMMEEKARRNHEDPALRHRLVELVVYNDVAIAPHDPGQADAFVAAEAERVAAGVRALVLGGPRTRALEELAARLPAAQRYSIPIGSHAVVESESPHPINDHAAAGAQLTLVADAKVVDPARRQDWERVYVGAGGDLVAMQHKGPTKTVVLGFGAAQWGERLGPNETDVVARAIHAILPKKEVHRHVVWEGPDALPLAAQQNERLVRATASGVYLVNGLELLGHTLTLRNVPQDVRIQNSIFKGDEGVASLVVEDVTGEVAVVGNKFEDADPAILVTRSPNVSIHYNAFEGNRHALKRGDGLAPALLDRVDARRNYLFQPLHVDSNNYAQHLLKTGRDAAAGKPRLNGVDAGFDVVPYCTDSECERTFPPLPSYLDDAGDAGVAGAQSTGPVKLTLVHRTGRTFDVSARDAETGETVKSLGEPAPSGWRRRTLLLDGGPHDVTIASLVGRGDYALVSVPQSIPKPQETLAHHAFAAEQAGWVVGPNATLQSDATGADGRPGVALLHENASLQADFAADPHALSVAFFLQLADAAAVGNVTLEWTPPNASEPLPIAELGYGASGFDAASWTSSAPVPLTPGSWHRVEVRLRLPSIDVYVDHAHAGTLPATTAPLLPGREAPLALRFTAREGEVRLDEPRAFLGEALAGLLSDVDFEHGAGDLVIALSGTQSNAAILNGTGSTTGNPKDVVDFFAVDPREDELRQTQTASSPSYDPSLEIGPTLERYTTSGGSAAYGNGRSLFIESHLGSEALLYLPLDPAMRRYGFEQYVSIPRDPSYQSFRLLELVTQSGETLLRVAFEDNNTYADVVGAHEAMNVARLASGQWHRVAAYVTETDYVLLVDGAPVAAGRLGAEGGPARWIAGGGEGTVIVDNLLFGHHGLLDEDATASSLLDAQWTATSTSTQGGVKVANAIVNPSPTSPSETPVLSSHAIRLQAPNGEASETWISRPLPKASEGAYEVRYSIYLPSETPLYETDGFRLLSLQTTTGNRLGIALHDPDDRVDLVRGSAAQYDDAHPTLARERWHDLQAIVGLDGSITLRVNGVTIATDGPGTEPVRLVVGDLTPGIKPLTHGGTGSGELYLDDLTIRRVNTAPSAAFATPAANAILSGHATLSGTAWDPDPQDAVTAVRVALSQDGARKGGPWLAEGTTSWTHLLNTTRWPHGTYALEAEAEDGRSTSAKATRSVTIDNRPVGGIQSPASGTRVGGLVHVKGTAAPRAPLSPGETLDALSYRIGAGEPRPLAATNGSWGFSWDTRYVPKGTHQVTVEATKWLDTATWTSTYYVDNSPLLTIDLPAAGARVGGTITFRGTAHDPYLAWDDVQSYALSYRVDNGWWMPVGESRSGPYSTWWATIDTHALPKGWHVLEIRGEKYGHVSTLTRSVYVDNTPILHVDTPRSGVLASDLLVVRGRAIDPYPTAWRPIPQNVTVQVDGGPEMAVPLTQDASWPGLATWRVTLDTRMLSNGAHDVVVRARDGYDVATRVVRVTVDNAKPAELVPTPRHDYVRGGGDGDLYTINVPTDATRLRITYAALEPGSGSKLYLQRGGFASPWSYQWISVGDGTNETIDITPVDGLVGGSYTLWVQAARPTDYTISATVTRVGVY